MRYAAAAMILLSIVCVVQGAEKVDDNKAILGTWRGGMGDNKGEDWEIVITADKITGTDLKGKRSLGVGTFKLDTEKHYINNVGTEGPANRKNYLGIYSLDGDTLKWASNNGGGGRGGPPGGGGGGGGGAKRPTELVHRPGQSFLMTLKRVKETPAEAGGAKKN